MDLLYHWFIFRIKMFLVQIQNKSVSRFMRKKLHLNKIKDVPFAHLQYSNIISLS